MFKSNVKLMTLKYLNQEPLSGYNLMNYLNVSGKKPSPGYIYPLLKDLQKNKFISMKREERRKIYSITDKGRKLLKNLQERRNEMINVMSKIGDKRELKDFIRLKSDMENGTYSLHDKMMIKKLNELVFSIHKTKKEGKKKKMESILKNTIKNLEKIKRFK